MTEPKHTGTTSAGESQLFGDAAGQGPAEEREAARVEASVASRLFGGPHDPVRIGRFTLINPVGKGGAGVVFAAYDPRLDRKVALKLLRGRADRSEAATARLLREAQVAGRLSHPNIVSVFDVAEYEGSAYITMEFIDGPDLAGWLAEEPRSSDEVLDLLTQAGRGLAEAHRSGVVHRDFKPANVMVQRGAAGLRARVVDFGLAGWGEMLPSQPDSGDGEPQSGDGLTRTGARLGTPAYMAPEQAEGKRADARSDQFSFCVSLVEGLTGSRPFDTVGDYTLDPEALAPIPTWIRAAVARGLARDPGERWASMDELLVRLDPPGRSRTRWVALAVASSLFAVALGYGLGQREEPQDEACTGAAAELAGVWDDDRRDGIRIAFERSSLGYAMPELQRVLPRLEEWAASWTSMHRDACEATQRRKEQSEAVLDLRMACLRDAKLGLEAATELLAGGSDAAIENAHEIVDRLPDLEGCADVEALLEDEREPSAEEAERVEQLETLVARAKAETTAGMLDQARDTIDRAGELAQDVTHPPSKAEVWLAAAYIHAERGEVDRAVELSKRAQALGVRHELWHAVQRATTALIIDIGQRQDRPNEVLPLRDLALALAAGSPLDEARTRWALGQALEQGGRYDEAEAELRAALELRRGALPAAHIDIATTQSALSTVLFRQGKVEESERHSREAMQSRLGALGPDHPAIATSRVGLATLLTRAKKLDDAERELRLALASVERAVPETHPLRGQIFTNLAALAHARGDFEGAEAQTRAAIAALQDASAPHHQTTLAARNNLAMILRLRGKLDEAEAEFREVLRIRLETLGAEHPDVARSHNNLAGFLQERQRYDEAEPHFRAALKARQATLRADHPEIASAHMSLGVLLRLQGDHAGAEGELRAALAIREKDLGPDHVKVARIVHSLGESLRSQGKLEEAEAVLRRALRIREAGLKPDNVRLGESQLVLGRTLLARGKRAEGLQLLARARDVFESPSMKPLSRAKLLFEVAQALWDTPTERPQARALAERAAGLRREHGKPDADALLAVETWLAEHPG